MGRSASSPTVSIWDQLALKNPIFSIYLNPGNDYLSKGTLPDDIEHGSEMIFGGVDSEHYKNCLHWHSPSNIAGTQQSWNVGLQTISVNQDDKDGIVSTSSIDISGYVTFDSGDRKSTRLNSSHITPSRMPSSA